jgi:V8-like Glu-specific endopeptidase
MRMLIAAALLALAVPLHGSDFSGARDTTRQIFAPKSEASMCSGVMVAPTRMLTAAHCTDGKMFVNGKPARLLKKDEDDDVAILEVDAGCPCAPIAESAPVLDEPVIVVGYPLNHTIRVQVLTEGRAQGQEGRRLRTTAPIAPGNSGGGVFVQHAGRWELVGIAVSTVTLCDNNNVCQRHPDVSFAATIDAIKRIL